MIDREGRNIDYLRISLTDRCNLRCKYCMPEEGISQLPHSEILTFDEIIRVCEVMARDGFRKIKLTGGEPLVRKNCAGLVAALKAVPGIEQVTLTTNGVLLKEQMPDLARAGIDAVNISLDTLSPERFREVTRRDSLNQVLEGIQAALEYPAVTLKINCVPIVSDRENLAKMAALAQKHPVHVRFIEMMPVGQGKRCSAPDEAEICRMLEETYGPMTPCEKVVGNGPGHYYTLEGFRGEVGFISAVSHKFCEKCNRIRLTADGFLKACLQYQIGEDLKGPIRSGCGDEELRGIIHRVLDEKPAGHHFYESAEGADEVRMMAQIGG